MLIATDLQDEYPHQLGIQSSLQNAFRYDTNYANDQRRRKR